jgi:hypothetical protein
MQFDHPCRCVGSDFLDSELAHISGLKQRLAERLKMTGLLRAGSASSADAGLRWRPGHDRPSTGCDHGTPTAARGARRPTIMQQLGVLLDTGRHDELRYELARAELAGHISEFHALNFHAILAVTEGSTSASDYLEMAEAAAASPYELAVIAETRAAYDLRQGNPFAAAERCLATMDHICQTEGLWIRLLIALDHLGELDTIDATLRSFMQLDDECTARIIRSMSCEPELGRIRAREAFRQLIDKRRAG